MQDRIVHCKHKPFDVYIGRPSIWGNPFPISPNASRHAVIEMYEEWIRNNPVLIDQLHTLKGKVLGCWCAPRRCHGDVLLKLMKEKGIE